jgi:hypothetical protein
MKFVAIGTVLLLTASVTVGFGSQATKSNAKSPATARPTQISYIRTPIGSSEMTVELPGKAAKINVPLEEKIRASYDILETIGVSTAELATFASYAVSRGSKPISLDGAARGALDRVKSQAQAEDYRETIANATVVGLPGRRIGCTFTAGGKKMFLSGLIFTDRTRMWQVIATGLVTPANTSVSLKVLSSVKRSSPGGGSGLRPAS